MHVSWRSIVKHVLLKASVNESVCEDSHTDSYKCSSLYIHLDHSDGVKLLWCHCHLVWLVLRVPSLHVLVFIQKTFCDF